jgi:hypothetical protein
MAGRWAVKKWPARFALTIDCYRKWGGEMKEAVMILCGNRRGVGDALFT